MGDIRVPERASAQVVAPSRRLSLRLTLLSVALAGACAAGCAGNPAGLPVPVAPSSVETAAPGNTLTFVSGETQAPVVGAAVLLDGHRYLTDAAGQVRVERPAGSGPLTAEAVGYLKRQTRTSSAAFGLWPKVSPTGLDETVTARLVYNCPANGCTGNEVLLRVVERRVFVVPAPGIRADAAAVATLEEATAKITASTGGQVSFTVSPSPPSGAVTVTVSVDPDDPDVMALGAAAVTRLYLGGRSSILRAEVVVRSLELVRRRPLLLHELGHAFGLGHSPRAGDVMWNGPELYESTDFSPCERLSMALMLQRLPGNHLPDDDQDAGASSTRDVQMIACRRR